MLLDVTCCYEAHITWPIRCSSKWMSKRLTVHVIRFRNPSAVNINTVPHWDVTLSSVVDGTNYSEGRVALVFKMGYFTLKMEAVRFSETLAQIFVVAHPLYSSFTTALLTEFSLHANLRIWTSIHAFQYVLLSYFVCILKCENIIGVLRHCKWNQVSTAEVVAVQSKLSSTWNCRICVSCGSHNTQLLCL